MRRAGFSRCAIQLPPPASSSAPDIAARPVQLFEDLFHHRDLRRFPAGIAVEPHARFHQCPARVVVENAAREDAEAPIPARGDRDQPQVGALPAAAQQRGADLAKRRGQLLGRGEYGGTVSHEDGAWIAECAGHLVDAAKPQVSQRGIQDVCKRQWHPVPRGQ